MSKILNGFKSEKELSDFFFKFSKLMKNEGECKLTGNSLLERFVKIDGWSNRRSISDKFSKINSVKLDVINEKKEPIDLFHNELLEYLMFGVNLCYGNDDFILSIKNSIKSKSTDMEDFFDLEKISFDSNYFGLYEFSPSPTKETYTIYKLADQLPCDLLNNGWSQVESCGFSLDSIISNAITLQIRDILKEDLLPELLSFIVESNILSLSNKEFILREKIITLIKNHI